MCYKGSISKEEAKIDYLQKQQDKSKKIRIPHKSYHFNAFSNPIINIVAQDEPNIISEATWGLIPFWGMSDPKKFLSGKQYTNNARGEDLYETKSYKNYVPKHRCVILFDGFFEPHHYDKKQNQPYFCYIPETSDGDYKNRELLSIGGIYSIVDDHYYVSLVTTEANDFFAEVHNNKKRMPLVLDNNLVKEWISPDQSKSVIDDLVRTGFTSKEFKAHPVSSDIYKTDFHRDGQEVIEPVKPIQDIFNTLF
ncbi:SOS response-associated peptidase [Christiangramia echinicola]|uniref:SOS response-associated peptidase n=1 Tax=Christiangramia echinicola TaxID=279359 RepID=UPI000426401C|nr:SOS response-associated peptidase family protein [Christiangramia echinicola]